MNLVKHSSGEMLYVQKSLNAHILMTVKLMLLVEGEEDRIYFKKILTNFSSDFVKNVVFANVLWLE